MPECIKCKRERAEELFAINPRTGEPNASCELCLSQTRKYQLRRSAIDRMNKIQQLAFAENPSDDIPWPATTDFPVKEWI